MTPFQASPISLNEEIRALASRLNDPCHQKYRYLFIPTDDPRAAMAWICASFYSPLAAIPLPPNLPASVLAEIIKFFPPEQGIFIHEVMGSTNFSVKEKPLSDIWAVILSSGSSGNPKIVALRGSTLRKAAISHQTHLGVRGPWLLNIPLQHIGGLSIVTRAYFLQQAVATAATGLDPQNIWGWIYSGAVEGLSMVPTVLHRLLNTSRLPVHSNFKFLLVGGAPADDDLIKNALALGLPVYRTYGMTEACSQIATEKTPGGGMQCLPGVEVKIVDNEVWVKSDSLADGVFAVGGEIKPLPLQDGFFATGDLGEMSDQGLKIIGRKSDLMISGGLNIFPNEIESALGPFFGFKEFAVGSVKDKEWGDLIFCAFVPFDEEFRPETAKEYLQARLDKRKIPKRWVRVEAIPRTATGKVRRLELANQIQKIILNP